MPVLATVVAITAIFYATSSDVKDRVLVPYSIEWICDENQACYRGIVFEITEVLIDTNTSPSVRMRV